MAIPWLVLHVELDLFDTAWSSPIDVIGDTLRFTTTRGMSPNPLQGFVAQTGTASLTLRNLDGDYAPDNASGPYYGQLLAGKRIRFRVELPDLSVDEIIWSGRVDRLRPGARVGGIPTLSITALGVFARLTDGRKVTPVPNTGDTTDVLLEALLNALQISTSERALDAGEITSGVWSPVEVDGLNEARLIVGTELGRLYEAKDGKVTFERRHYRRETTRSNTIQLTLSDDAADDDAYRVRSIDESDPAETQYDKIAVNFTPVFTVDASFTPLLSVGGPALGGGITIPPGQSRLVGPINPFWYPFLVNLQPGLATLGPYFVAEWQNPVTDGSDPLTTGSIVLDPGSGAPQSALSISNIVTTTHTIQFILTNSDPTDSAYVSYVSIWGRRGSAGSPVRQVVGSGLREYPLPGPYYPEAGSALAGARWLLDYFAPPRKWVTLDIPALRAPELCAALVAREVGDRVRVRGVSSRSRLYLDADFFWEGASWSYEVRGPTIELACSPWLSACLPNVHDNDAEETGLPSGAGLYYPMNEETGDIYNVVPEHTYDLARHGPASEVGVVGPSQEFVWTENDYLVNEADGYPDDTLLGDWEWNGWIWVDGDTGADQTIIEKGLGGQPSYRLSLHRIDATHRYVQGMVYDGTEHVAIHGSPLVVSTWYFVRFTHDATLKQITVSVDLQFPESATYTGTIDGTDPGLILGASGVASAGGPLVTTNLLVDYDIEALGLSDGTNISTMTDYSGNGHDATGFSGHEPVSQSSGGPSGKRYAAFSGSHIAKTTDSGFLPSGSAERVFFFVVKMNGATPPDSSMMQYGPNGSTGQFFAAGTGSGLFEGYFWGLNTSIVNPGGGMNVWHAVALQIDSAGHPKWWADGTQLSNDTGVTPSTTNTTVLSIGGNGNAGGTGDLQGQIARVLLHGALTDTEIGDQFAYLQSEYGTP